MFLLHEMGRYANFQPAEFGALALAHLWDTVAAKKARVQATEEARNLFELLPPGDLGCVYLRDGKLATPRSPEEVESLSRHRGSLRGAWPTIS